MDITQHGGYSRIKLFMALSRTPHGLLDMCTPLLAALLWLGHSPEPQVILEGMIAAFAGYTAVYALNDIVDYRHDKEKISQAGFRHNADYLDAAYYRHPLAQGFLSMPEAIAWAGGWMLVSLLFAYLLNPVCALILVGGCVLEVIYCRLLQITHLRTLVSGIVKTLGGLAAIFAVDATPNVSLLLLLFLWLFFWEIGGQNVPADWHDIQEDTLLKARTVPVTLGPRTASTIVMATLAISVALSAILFRKAPLHFPLPLYLAAVILGVYLLIIPALHLFRTRDREEAAVLFNRASLYPGILLVIVLSALSLQFF